MVRRTAICCCRWGSTSGERLPLMPQDDAAAAAAAGADADAGTADPAARLHRPVSDRCTAQEFYDWLSTYHLGECCPDLGEASEVASDGQSVVTEGPPQPRTVADIMLRRELMVVCTPRTGTDQVIELMQKHKVSCVVVLDELTQSPVGLATHWSVIAGALQGVPLQYPVAKVMNKVLAFVPPDATREQLAAAFVQHNTAHVIVADAGRGFLGVASSYDLCRLGGGSGSEPAAWGGCVRDLMQRAPLTVPHTAPLFDVARQLLGRQREGLGSQCAVVLNSRTQELVGLVTMSDLVFKALAQRAPTSGPVTQVLTRELIALHEDAPQAELAATLRAHHIHHVVVVDAGGAFRGVVSSYDLAVADADPVLHAALGATAS